MTKPVREALDKVVDRESIAKNVSKNHATPATGPFNTKLDFIDKQQVQKQDIDEAKNNGSARLHESTSFKTNGINI